MSITILFIGCSSKTEANHNEENNTNVEMSDGYSLEFGELVDVNTSEFGDKKIIVIKAKIKPSFNNESTINQNGFNVENLICEQGVDEFDEIQYLAVADMNNGSEEKVISFTVNKEMIQKIKNKEMVGNKIVENAQDVWCLPSLKQ